MRHRIWLPTVTMPIQSQGSIFRDDGSIDISVDVSAVAYFKVLDAVKSVIAIENVGAAIDQIAQTTLRKVVGQHTLDETLSKTDTMNLDTRAILDVSTIEWGVQGTLVELEDIQVPETMKRAMPRQADAERESPAAAAMGGASDTMMAHPWALQLRNLRTRVELSVDNNTTVVFAAPLMSMVAELGAFLTGGSGAALRSASQPPTSAPEQEPIAGAPTGTSAAASQA